MVADTLQIVKIKFRNIRITLNRINPGNRISDYKYNEYTDSNKTEIKDITLYTFVFISMSGRYILITTLFLITS